MVPLSADNKLAEIAKLLEGVEPIEMTRVPSSPSMNAALCCGCVCVSYCLANSSVAMQEMVSLVAREELVLPVDLRSIIQYEMRR